MFYLQSGKLVVMYCELKDWKEKNVVALEEKILFSGDNFYVFPKLVLLPGINRLWFVLGT
jgi:hypothetical protein